MTQIILEKFKPYLVDKLKSLAVQNHRSLEEEVMAILEQALEIDVEINFGNKKESNPAKKSNGRLVFLKELVVFGMAVH